MPNLNIHPAPLGGPFEESPHELTAQWLGAHLRKALREGSFEVHYQPLVTAKREPEAYEALVRFRHPKLGMVPPAKFIPMAERNGMIVPIGEWVLQEACSQAAQWAGIGVRRPVSVNVSARQLTRDFVGTVEHILQRNGLSPQMLQLEMTESFALSNWSESLHILSCLKALGVAIAVDDFGTGYSSLSYLKRLPIDVVKIDRSFVESVEDPHFNTRAIVGAIVSMARDMGVRTVAEGVESEAQFYLLRELGCDLFQGYLFARPRPAAVLFSERQPGRLQ